MIDLVIDCRLEVSLIYLTRAALYTTELLIRLLTSPVKTVALPNLPADEFFIWPVLTETVEARLIYAGVVPHRLEGCGAGAPSGSKYEGWHLSFIIGEI